MSRFLFPAEFRRRYPAARAFLAPAAPRAAIAPSEPEERPAVTSPVGTRGRYYLGSKAPYRGVNNPAHAKRPLTARRLVLDGRKWVRA
jgi:hypothetical protein